MQICHTYKIAVSKYILREHLGGGVSDSGGQDGFKRRNEVFVKIQKRFFFYLFFFFLGGGGVGLGGGGSGWM